MTSATSVPSTPSDVLPWHTWCWGRLLVGIVLVVYLPTLACGFVSDDEMYVVHNVALALLSLICCYEQKLTLTIRAECHLCCR